MAKYRPKPLGTRVCAATGCNNLTADKFCSQCGIPKRQAEPRTERDRFLDTKKWQRLRQWKISQTPYCEECEKEGNAYVAAVDVDHIYPRRTHPQLALDARNLQSLCKSHHSRKTATGR